MKVMVRDQAWPVPICAATLGVWSNFNQLAAISLFRAFFGQNICLEHLSSMKKSIDNLLRSLSNIVTDNWLK